jgi:hypothetical protein
MASMRAKLRSIRPLSLLKLVAGSFGAIYTALAVLFGLLGMAGCNTVHWNREAVTGVWALPVAFLISVFLWIASTLFVWVALAVGFPLVSMIDEIVIEGEAASEKPNQPQHAASTAVTPPAPQEPPQA